MFNIRINPVIVLVTTLAVVLGLSLAPRADEMNSRTARSTSPSADSRCPSARAPGRAGPEHALRAVRRHIRAGKSGIKDARDYRIVDLLSLSRQYEGVSAAERTRYRKLAIKACNAKAADASFVVFVHFQRAAFADLAPAAQYVARTDSGWRVWYRAYPNAGTHEFASP